MTLILSVIIISTMKKPRKPRHFQMGHIIIINIEHRKKIRFRLFKDNCRLMMEVAMFGDFLIVKVPKSSMCNTMMGSITLCSISRLE